jgi:hypothetical protein
MHKWHGDFIPWFGQCLLHVVVTSFGQGLHSIPLKWSKDQTWVPRLSSFSQVFPLWEPPQVGVSHPYKIDHNSTTRISEGMKPHTRQTYSDSCTQNKREEHKHSTTELQLNTSAQISINESKGVNSMSRRCCMFNEWLVFCSMHLGVPFIAPRQLGAVWVPFGRLWLPSVCGCTGQSGTPPDSEQCVIPFLFWRSRPLQSLTLVAHRIVWWHTG